MLTTRASLATLVVVLGALAASPAHAYCRTSNTSTKDFDGHVCTPPADDDTGIVLYWGMPRITYSLQQDASEDVPFEAARTALRGAFDAWMAADCDGEPPRVEVIEAEPAVCALHEYNSERGNANIVFFQDQDWDDEPSRLAVTTVTFLKKTGEIYDADMVLNSALYTFTTDGSEAGIDLASVLTHEAGHFLGLAHSPVPDATMGAAYSPPSVKDLRTLAPDDEAGICAIFPPGPIAEGCDATPRHGFSVLCEADQPGPVPDEPAATQRCCCVEGAECIDGLCIDQGCSCTTAPAPSSPWSAATPLAAVVAVLVRRRPRRRR